MSSINYIEIIKRAWNITWHNRYLWWFGLFIALGSPGMSHSFDLGENKETDSASVQKIIDFMSAHLQWIIVGIVALLIVAIILTVLGIIARAGLIKSLHSIDQNKLAGFRSGMREGKKYFWKLLLLGLSLFFLISASILILAIPVIFLIVNKSYALGIFLGFLAFMIFVPVMILFAFLRIYGYFYIVLGELSAWNAVEKAYELFQNNLLPSIIMGLFFIPLGMAIMMAVILCLIPLAIIFIAVGFVLYLILGNPGAIAAAIAGAVCFLVMLFALRSVYETFAQTVWYLFFNEIAKSKAEETVSETVLEEEKEKLPTPEPVKTAEIEE